MSPSIVKCFLQGINETEVTYSSPLSVSIGANFTVQRHKKNLGVEEKGKFLLASRPFFFFLICQELASFT